MGINAAAASVLKAENAYQIARMITGTGTCRVAGWFADSVVDAGTGSVADGTVGMTGPAIADTPNP